MRIAPCLAGLSALGLIAAAPIAPDLPFRPGEVSTPAAEVRIAFSPDGRRILWGSIGRDGPEDQQDIWEMHRDGAGWSAPARASFDTDAVEFDPAFSPDGTRLYFHSDRPGGYGGTDLYVVDVDPATGAFSAPRNLGPRINSAGDEWAPTPTRDGKLLFASDGWGGLGAHDLFEAVLGEESEARPRNLGPAINSAEQDFDAALSPDGNMLIFSAGRMDDEIAEVRLYRSDRQTDGSWGARVPLGTGCADFAIGSSFDPNDPGHFYYAARCEGGNGRMDIRQVPAPATTSASSPSP